MKNFTTWISLVENVGAAHKKCSARIIVVQLVGSYLTPTRSPKEIN